MKSDMEKIVMLFKVVQQKKIELANIRAKEYEAVCALSRAETALSTLLRAKSKEFDGD